MQLSPFSRGVEAGTLNLVNLLKLAKVADEHPSIVLRMARKSAEADLLEALYGSGRDALAQSHRELIETWEAISPDLRPHLVALLREVAQRSSQHRASSAENAEPPKRIRQRGRGRARAAGIAH
jgi:hypothetical protein